MSMTPLVGDRDIVSEAARALFASVLRSQPSVRDVFFSEHRADPREHMVDSDWFDFDAFAAMYVCQCLSKVKDEFDIHGLVDEVKVDEEMEMVCSSGDWKKVGKLTLTLIYSYRHVCNNSGKFEDNVAESCTDDEALLYNSLLVYQFS